MILSIALMGYSLWLHGQCNAATNLRPLKDK